MLRASTILLTAAASMAAGTGSAEQISVSGDDCETVRILKDGSEVRSMSKSDESARGSARGGTAKAVSVRSGSGSSRSSVSVSSSSSGAGHGSARAVSSVTDADGRTITTTHDENGCTIVVDERGA